MNWKLYIAITDTGNGWTWYGLSDDDKQIKIINCRHFGSKETTIKYAKEFLEKSGIKGNIEE